MLKLQLACGNCGIMARKLCPILHIYLFFIPSRVIGEVAIFHFYNAIGDI